MLQEIADVMVFASCFAASIGAAQHHQLFLTLLWLLSAILFALGILVKRAKKNDASRF